MSQQCLMCVVYTARGVVVVGRRRGGGGGYQTEGKRKTERTTEQDGEKWKTRLPHGGRSEAALAWWLIKCRTSFSEQILQLLLIWTSCALASVCYAPWEYSWALAYMEQYRWEAKQGGGNKIGGKKNTTHTINVATFVHVCYKSSF